MMIPDGIMTDGGRDKITGDQQGALVDQLIKGMLTIGTGLTPDHGAGSIAHGLAVPIHGLAIALHIALLKIGGKSVHILIIRQYRLRLRTKEISVPEPDQGHRHGDILFESCRAEMVVGLMGPVKQGFEMIVPDAKRDGQAD